jgi:hypothetical protein
MRTAGVGSGAILRDVEQATMNVAAVQTIAPKVGSFIDNLMIYRKTSDRQVLIYEITAELILARVNFTDLRTNVRHEHDDSGSKLLECATTRLMRVGPSEPVCRDRFQTTSSGADQKSGS